MHVTWISDIHFEFLSDTAITDFLRAIRQTCPDAVLITGDIGQAPSLVSYLSEMESLVRCPIYFVLGNHDYYHGSIAAVRQQVGRKCSTSSLLHYLTDCDAVSLSAATCLIGHDGWGDGRLGDFTGSTVELNDFVLIDELSGLSRPQLLNVLQGLGDEAAEHLRAVLPDALARHRHVVVLTHVPPFREAAWYENHHCDDDFLPFFGCKATGDVLRQAMLAYPDRQMTVLCGHTHGAGQAQILPNLTVYTGGASYRCPAVQKVFEWP
jgi:Icc protein